MMEKKPVGQFRWMLASILAVVIGLLIISGPQLYNGVPFVTGDIWDGRIMISLLEHWWNVVRGLENPVRPIYFHPFKTTLAYNDGNLLSGLVYSVPRALGADPFLSYEIMNWTVRAAGGLGMVALARSAGLRPGYAFAAAVLLMISSNMVFRMSHAQLLFVGLTPWGIVLFANTLRVFTEQSRLRAYLAAAAFALFVWIWAMTAFYSLFGFGLILIGFLIIGLLLSPTLRSDCIEAVKRRPGAVFFAVVLFAVAVLAVLKIYRSSGQSHNVADMRALSGGWSDAINLGAGGLWSKLVHGNVDAAPLAISSHSYGFTPILLMAFLGGLAWLLFQSRSPEERFTLSLGLAGLGIGILAFRTAGLVHWEPFFQFLPGAQAIRVPLRLLLTVTPIVIFVAVFAASRLPPLVGASLLALIAVEQITPYRPFLIDRSAERMFLAAVPPSPAECQAFFLSELRFEPSGNRTIDAYYAAGVDAMIIAETRRIPTINGIATVQPRGWNLAEPFDATYRQRALDYAVRMGVRPGLCSLNLKTNQWSLEQP